ncbi:MAG: DUF2868 domain-containing protein [Acidobacteriota bacterium]
MYTYSVSEAQPAVFVHVVEENDRRGDWVPLDERREASRACESIEDDGRFVATRARQVLERLKTRHGWLGWMMRLTDLGRGLLVPTVVVTLVVGLATNALGPSKQIHVLAVPLLVLIAWNVLSLALLAIRALLPLAPGLPRLLKVWRSLVRRWVSKMTDRLASDGDETLVERVVDGYLERWLPLVTPLAVARIRRLLHVGALMTVLGAVAGMYVRGLVLAYQASWESTFLDATAVQRLLDTVLGSAALVLGTVVPDASLLEAPATGDAGPWIHLWAVTALLFVGVPRVVLIGLESARVARRRRLEVALDDAYVRRLRASVATDARQVVVLPFSYRPSELAVTGLRDVLHDVFGARAEVRISSSLGYGDEWTVGDGDGVRARVVLFSAAQTPEVEVHGEVLRRVRDETADGQMLVMLVDGGPHARRLGARSFDDPRLATRRRSWDGVAERVALEVVHVDLETPADVSPSRVAAAVWPRLETS